jgi:hypothetical protein
LQKQKAPISYREQVDEIVPRLQQTAQRLKDLESTTARQAVVTVLPKFIMLWIVLIAVGLIFDVVQQVWGYLLMGAMILWNRRRRSIERQLRDEGKIRRHERVADVVQWALALAGSLPNILRWSISLAMFVVLFVPVFNEVAVGLGSSYTFADVWSDVRSLRFAEALRTLQEILFP